MDTLERRPPSNERSFPMCIHSIRSITLLMFISSTIGFTPSHQSSSNRRALPSRLLSTKAPPRTGFGQQLLNFALQSPLWKLILVPQARQNIVKTAEANGIPWRDAKAWIESKVNEYEPIKDAKEVPEYYRKAYHAYEEGNLCWDAAYEVEIASCSVGARNFPQYGSQGEDAFRGAFDSALLTAGAHVPDKGKILDLGCGTGMSTRRLGRNWPQASQIEGIDLSAYFVRVGSELLGLAPIQSFQKGGPWVSDVEPDSRISLKVGDAANTGLPDEFFDVVNLQFVLHELPPGFAVSIVQEAYRVLKAGGQLWICEMDFESPAYAAQRANALLFSLIRSTEPYLDEYAESISSLFTTIQQTFGRTTVVAATGRHYALVAEKNSDSNIFEDLRFDENDEYRVEDTHLKVWESKQDS